MTSTPRRRDPRTGRTPPTARPARVRRVPVIAGIVALLAAGGLVDRSSGGHLPTAAPVAPVPTAAPPGALSSAWFCGGATARKGGAASGTIVVADPTSSSLTGSVTLLPSNGAALAPRAFSVAAGSRLSLAETVPGGAPWVAADVIVDGGGVSVEQQITGPLGTAAQPCATTGSPSWSFPSGTTVRNASDVVSLMNPYPADAIVDLTFVTNQGVEDPSAFQALLVPADSLVTVDLGTHLRRRTAIATTATARTGQIVAWQTQVVTPPAPGTPIIGRPVPAGLTGPVDPAPPTGGVVLTLGAPSPAVRWWWPDGAAGGGVTEEYVVYNPGSATAQLRLTYGLGQGGSQPVTVTVAPTSVATVVTNDEQLPSGAAHDATLVSLNGVPVVAERTVTAVAPSARTGLGGLLGGRLAARRWLLGAGSATSHLDEWVEIQDPGTLAATVSVAVAGPGGLTPLPGLQDLTVAPGARVAVRVAQHVSSPFAAALVVSASQPVVVERDLYGTRTPGIDLALGVPLTP